ncbi:MAG TPA: phosphatase PAP2-related protein [Candidatus Binatia bacterium]|nr:phosphatase PAP2-related protein [Candidatus Binatia bacterium]
MCSHHRPEITGLKEPPAQTADTPPWRLWLIRAVLVGVSLAAWFGTQALIQARPDPPADESRAAGIFLARHDALLQLTRPIHDRLLQHRGWADWLLIASSAMVDGLGIFLLARAIFGPSIRPLIGLLLIFGLRQLMQQLCPLPPPGGPENVIWHNPGVPSLLVTYGVTKDLFFSGHTAIAVFGAIEVGRLGRKWLPVAAVIVLFEVAVVLVLWAHYTMDVYAGAITAVCMVLIADRIAPACDRALGRLVAPGPIVRGEEAARTGGVG